MSNLYSVEIRDGSKGTYSHKDVLKKNGFIWNGKCWTKQISDQREVSHWEDWSRLRGLRMKAIGGDSERGSNYRKQFFDNNPPMFGSKYVCAYCGRRLTKKQVQVDHIIPVELAKKRADIREKIHSYGWESVNDPENLCAACSTCNRRKSSKGGLWIARGRLGKKKWWQCVMLALRALFSIVIGAAVSFLNLYAGILVGVLLLIALVFIY